MPREPCPRFEPFGEHDGGPFDSDWPDPEVDPFELPMADDSDWDVFVPDADQVDPLPEPGDFWIEPSEANEFLGLKPAPTGFSHR